MSTIKRGCATAIALTTIALLGTIGCGESPTAVRGRSAAAAHDPQVECYIIDGQIHCKTAVHIEPDSVRKP